MNHSPFLRALFGIAFLLLTIAFLTGPLGASAKKADPGADFKGSPGWKKCDLRARQAWEEAYQEKKLDKPLEGILKTSATPTRDQLAQLKSAGFQTRSTIGPISTGSTTVEKLPGVMALQFVEAFELAVPLLIK